MAKKKVNKKANKSIEKKLQKFGKAVGSKIDKLTVQSVKAKKQAQIKYAKHISMLDKKLKATEAKLKKLEGQSDHAWHDVKQGAGAAWIELKKSFDKAFDEYK
ncbi:MAG: hypothetical protein WC795_03310 [Candidatus Paceibacterota bacterium]|jgi:hypothetical protein